MEFLEVGMDKGERIPHCGRRCHLRDGGSGSGDVLRETKCLPGVPGNSSESMSMPGESNKILFSIHFFICEKVVQGR